MMISGSHLLGNHCARHSSQVMEISIPELVLGLVLEPAMVGEKSVDLSN